MGPGQEVVGGIYHGDRREEEEMELGQMAFVNSMSLAFFWCQLVIHFTIMITWNLSKVAFASELSSRRWQHDCCRIAIVVGALATQAYSHCCCVTIIVTAPASHHKQHCIAVSFPWSSHHWRCKPHCIAAVSPYLVRCCISVMLLSHCCCRRSWRCHRSTNNTIGIALLLCPHHCCGIGKHSNQAVFVLTHVTLTPTMTATATGYGGGCPRWYLRPGRGGDTMTPSEKTSAAKKNKK